MPFVGFLLSNVLAAHPRQLTRNRERPDVSGCPFSGSCGMMLLLGGIALAYAWKWYQGKKSPVLEEGPSGLAKQLSKEMLMKVRQRKVTADEVAKELNISDVKGISEAVELLGNAGQAEEIVESLRAERYSSENPMHEELLERLWKALKPGVTRKGRKTSEWGDLGFQGNDPATDFRGNGVLGLANLVYFAENHTDLCRKILVDAGWNEETQVTMKWYLFAVTGINLTSHVTKLLKAGSLDRHFYHCVVEPLSATPDPLQNTSIVIHSQLYSSLFTSFHDLWLKHKPSVMEFNQFVESTVYPVNTGDTLEKA